MRGPTIVIDALTAQIGSGPTYVRSFLPALRAVRPDYRLFVMLSPQYQQALIDGVPDGVEVIPVPLRARPLVRRFWYQQTDLVSLLARVGADLLYAPAESAYLRGSTPLVILAGNASIYATGAGARFSLRSLIYRATRFPLVWLSMHRAARIACVSATFRDYLSRVLRLPLDRFDVVHHGVNPAFLTANEPAGRDQSDYVLYVGTLAPHKNVQSILRAIALMAGNRPRLKLAGWFDEHDDYYRFLRAEVNELGLTGDVDFLGELTHKELVQLYSNARAVIMPSRLETFGHPLVEAMATYAPVIASELPICHEICGDAALYFEPDDTAALSGLITSVMTDNALATELGVRGRARAEHFSWQRSAQELAKVFDRVLVNGAALQSVPA